MEGKVLKLLIACKSTGLYGGSLLESGGLSGKCDGVLPLSKVVLWVVPEFNIAGDDITAVAVAVNAVDVPQLALLATLTLFTLFVVT